MPTPDPETHLPPFDLENPNPEPWRFANEVHRQGHSLEQFRRGLEMLYHDHPRAYMKLVALIRSQNELTK